jgi:hypothetical protein
MEITSKNMNNKDNNYIRDKEYGDWGLLIIPNHSIKNYNFKYLL